MLSSNIIKSILCLLVYVVSLLSFLFIRVQFIFLFLFFAFIFLFYFSKRIQINTLLRLALFIITISLIILSIKYSLLSLVDPFRKIKISYIRMELFRYFNWKISNLLGQAGIFIIPFIGFFLPFPSFVFLNSGCGIIPIDYLKLPLDLEITLISSISVIGFFKYKKVLSKFLGVRLIFYMIIVTYIGLVISNFISYERQRLFLNSLLYVFFSHVFLKADIKFKLISTIIFLIIALTISYNVLRGLAHGVF